MVVFDPFDFWPIDIKLLKETLAFLSQDDFGLKGMTGIGILGTILS